MAYSGRRAPQVPPDKGSFPLDHEGICTEAKTVFLTCLKTHAGQSQLCRTESLEYLKCRMDKNLMASESLEGLGFDPNIQPLTTKILNPSEKEKKGFVAGLTIKPIPKKDDS